MNPPTWAYQVENFEPPPPFLDELICSVCQAIFCDPVQLNCNHVFCRACIDKWLEDNRTCPICRKRTAQSALKEVVPLLKNMIMKLTLRCRNKDCSVKFALENCHSHMDICDYETIACRNKPCKVKFIRKDQQEHETNTCSHRCTLCKHCALKVGLEPDNHNCISSLKQALKEKDDLLRRKDKTIEELEEKLRNSRIQRPTSNTTSSSSWTSTVSDFSDVEISLDRIESTPPFNPSPFSTADSPFDFSRDNNLDSPLGNAFVFRTLASPFEEIPHPPTPPRPRQKRSHPGYLSSSDDDSEGPTVKRPWWYTNVDPTSVGRAQPSTSFTTFRRSRSPLTSFLRSPSPTTSQAGTSRTRGIDRLVSHLNSDADLGTTREQAGTSSNAGNTPGTTRMRLPKREPVGTSSNAGNTTKREQAGTSSNAGNTPGTARMRYPRREQAGTSSNAGNTSGTTRMQLPRREQADTGSNAGNTSGTTRMRLPRKKPAGTGSNAGNTTRREQAGAENTPRTSRMRLPRREPATTDSNAGNTPGTTRMRLPRREPGTNAYGTQEPGSNAARTSSNADLPSGTTRMQLPRRDASPDSVNPSRSRMRKPSRPTRINANVASGTTVFGRLTRREEVQESVTFRRNPPAGSSRQLSPARSTSSDDSSSDSFGPFHRAALIDTVIEEGVQSTLRQNPPGSYYDDGESLWIPPDEEWSDYDLPSFVFDQPITSSDESSLLSTVSDVSSGSVEVMTPPRLRSKRSDRIHFSSSTDSSDEN